MFHYVRKPWQLHQSQHTPQEIFENRKTHRREFLQTMGYGIAGAATCGLWSGCSKPTAEEISQAGAVEPLPEASAGNYPAKRNEAFEYGRLETLQSDAAEYTNFYEFSPSKDSWRYVSNFEPTPWSFEIDGLCDKPRKLDMDDVYAEFSLEERQLRHRCVETWAMCVPWTGFQLSELLKSVEPKPSAKFVSFETFNRPSQASHMENSIYPWPYAEGLTIDEAMNELAFVATGIYGEPLPKQHGAPIRLVLPWKYGFKSIKSIVRITLTDKQPATFWNTVNALEYDFQANVNPEVSHPRWSQKTEWMLGSRKRHDTVVYNGYGDYVGGLYPV